MTRRTEGISSIQARSTDTQAFIACKWKLGNRIESRNPRHLPLHLFVNTAPVPAQRRGLRLRLINIDSSVVVTSLARELDLSIRDALTLERSRLNKDDELLLYRAKTGNPVYVPLPAAVAEALRNIPAGPKPNPRYFFWSGNGSPKSVVGNWQRSYRRLFEIAGIRKDDGTRKRCHPHIFRDTFAVEMLLAGVPLDQVSILLGHKCVRITEKHYAPWVKARQQQLASSVRKAWTVIEKDSAKRSKSKRAPKRRAFSTS